MKHKNKGLNVLKILAALLMLFWVVAGVVLSSQFWRVELISKELYGFVPVVANSYSIDDKGSGPQLNVQYSYDYAGKTYEGWQLSPYNELTVKASLDERLRKWLTRPDELKLTVFVDPDDPSRSSVVRGWARENRIEKLAYGMFIVALGLVGLYYLFRPINRVEELF